jgi:Ser/Thr protein kinase RdoA (MazF antagonist)
VESIIDMFQSQIIDSGVASSFRIGINHGDFNDANILIGNDYKVSGVIDFGDSVERYV